MPQYAHPAFHLDLRTLTEALDAVINAMIGMAGLAETEPEKLKAAPMTTPVSRRDETAAARNLNIACL